MPFHPLNNSYSKATLAELGAPPVNVEQVVAEYRVYGDKLRPYVGDASRFVHQQITAGKNVLFEGAQGALLDVDLGTYPFVTSSNTTAGGTAVGSGGATARSTAASWAAGCSASPKSCAGSKHCAWPKRSATSSGRLTRPSQRRNGSSS